MRRLLALVLAAAALAGCLGPKPAVRSAEVAPPEDGRATVTVVIENRGGGDGQVKVKIALRDASDRVVAREDKTADLRPRETITLVLELDVPDDARELRVDADVVYPPD